MTVVSLVVGATTPTTARVVAKLESDDPVRLLVADNPGLSGGTLSDPVTPGVENVAHLEATGLAPSSRYWFAVEVDGQLDTTFTGQLRTHPPLDQPATFTYAQGHCAGPNTVPGVDLWTSGVSNHPVFDTIRQSDPLFFAHLGDLHYRDPDGLQEYIDGWDAVLSAPRQHQLYRQVPWVYMADDHEYVAGSGAQNGDRTWPHRADFIDVFRRRSPHYPTAGGPDGPLGQQWRVGRVQFVMPDLRTERDPNADPQGPDKTMLGSRQLGWLEDILATSPAELLVVMMTSLWHEPRLDCWSSFVDEREKLVEMFGDYGWLDRMLMHHGDRHALGLVTPQFNPHGQFPIYLFGSLDSVGDLHSALPRPDYEPGTVYAASNQWGQVTIDDRGSEIVVSGRAMQGQSQFWSHTFTVDLTPPPAPPPAVDTVAHARLRTEVSWLSFNLTSGRLITELPGLQPGEIARTIGTYETAAHILPIETVGATVSDPATRATLASQATEPARTAIVAVVNDIPAWVGIVLRDDGDHDGPMQLSCLTPEAYFGRRIVRDLHFSGTDMSTIMAGLASHAEDIDGIGQGLGLVHDIEDCGTIADRTYLASDRATVLQRMQELMDVRGGPEFTIDCDWQPGMEGRAIRLILRVRRRIGRAADRPSAVFESLGESDARYRFTRDHSDGRAANWVEAYAPGEGDDQPSSAPAIDVDALAAGAPILERHWQPSSSIRTQSVLDDHAVAELERLRFGTVTYELDVRWDRQPRFGLDWFLGDDVAWEVKGVRHPDGIRAVGRMVGWKLDIAAGRMKPLLVSETEVPL